MTRQELIAKGWDPDPLFQIARLPRSHFPQPRIGDIYDKEEGARSWLEQNGWAKNGDVYTKDGRTVFVEHFYVPLTL